jgi:hypothetical protein
MLFDLRGRGRRRLVQVVYTGIAVLFLAGFIGFGVGSGLGGNFNIGELLGKGGGSSYSQQVEKARKRTRREPNNPAAWAALTEAQIRQASEPAYTNQSTSGYTAQGRKYLPKIEASWKEYLRLEPRNPSAELAHRMLGILGEEGTAQPAAEVQALQIAIAAEPSNKVLYLDLAEYAYQAGNSRQGDLASEKVLGLASKAERPRLKGELTALKKNGGHITGTRAAAAAGTEGTEGG